MAMAIFFIGSLWSPILLAEKGDDEEFVNEELKSEWQLILQGKYKLINGDLKMAEFYFNKISEQSELLVLLKKRYLSIIEFIKGHYEQSLALIDDQKINTGMGHFQVCQLQIIDYLALGKTDELKDEAPLCLEELARFSKNNVLWTRLIIDLKTRNFKSLYHFMYDDLYHTLNDEEMVKIWPKLGLYLNKEKEFLALLHHLPGDAYRSKKIREIIALFYLRTGETKEALKFIDDIDSANAETIKGTINLIDKEYELAYGHFKLALQKKEDSQNALTRAIPLSFMLGQFEDGLDLLKKSQWMTHFDARKKETLKIAFLIRLKKYSEAQKSLMLLKNDFRNLTPFEVNIMDNFVGLVLSQKGNREAIKNFEESAESSCKAFDGLSCWLSLSVLHWKEFGTLITRDELISKDGDFNLDDLRTKKDIHPLVEVHSIDQKDIEELDSDSVKIRSQKDI